MEIRDDLLDDAFNAPAVIVSLNAKSFIEALIHVLRYHGGINTPKDHGKIGQDEVFRKASSHFFLCTSTQLFEARRWFPQFQRDI